MGTDSAQNGYISRILCLKLFLTFWVVFLAAIQSDKRDMLDFFGLTRSDGADAFELPAVPPLVSRYPHLIEKFGP